jgi:hypothetical protein
MSGKDFGKALMRGEDPIDLQALTLAVLRRDRRRVWILSAICFVAWMMVVMLPWATVLPAMAKISNSIGKMNGLTVSEGAAATQRQQDLLSIFQVLKEGTMVTFALSIGSMFVAALCTVILVVVSRRATLRQVNARLAEISAQLKAMAGNSK